MGGAGEAGPAGPQGVAGVMARWTSYREFWYDADRADIHPSDAGKIANIAAYMKQNPSLTAGIDSTQDASDQNSRDMATRRGNAIRDALIAAGVPSSSIQSGTYGDARFRRDRRVEVLVKTAN